MDQALVRGRWIATIATALLAGACGSEPPDRADILLTLDTSEAGACAQDSCDAYGMSCGARVSVRVTDVQSGELLSDQNGRPLELCLDADVSETICSLEDLAPLMELSGMPARPVRVEVAVWNADDVADDGGCLNTEFDLAGRPSVDSAIPPAFGGAMYFRAGEDSDLTVPLSCPAPSRLNSPSCAANLPTNTFAELTDMDALQRIQDEGLASQLTVRVGTATQRLDENGVAFYELPLSKLSDLDLDLDGSGPVWRNAIPLPSLGNDDLVCSAVVEFGPQATPTVTCEQVAREGDLLEVSPLYLSSEVLGKVLEALGLESFPAGGLVIGRVVTEEFLPMPDVEVLPSDGSSVLYLSDDLSSVAPGLTSNSGFFVSTTTAYGANWTARTPTGATQAEQPRAGRIAGTLSTVLIQMTFEVNE